MDLRRFLLQSSELPNWAGADDFVAEWAQTSLAKGAHLTRQDMPETEEFIVLEGQLVSSICDPDGKEVCVGFHHGPCVITPNIARTRNGNSLVSIEAMTDAKIARIESDRLTDLMISSEPVRNWANAILQDALSRKADREWCLAALGGADRLAWFREIYPAYEEIFTHSLIASYLGVTPVTLSRLRNAK
ncbi:Crp/Fnr family transcriptional regulator [Octadecabacter sp. 1_MG-2023]|uniref:Crp/Fnr family transcriptional regulator n=1 Tax=unclassified Octadecabacter TaxID=196158 RepID=UPI001C085B57|nr:MULTISPECIES: Crp/Fnr family transcriptional regulator [unclassified Octadecabacter]MBU2993653.1 Crp/Fnr family transcriptional regulator [Octadecabacter sp. B2R22]MDO6735503.1 Crp/Fnr family transcriptional regulator [Octadecabacter sp. 1_MG-2023]